MKHCSKVFKFFEESFLSKNRVEGDGWKSEIPVNLYGWGGELIGRGLVRLFQP